MKTLILQLEFASDRTRFVAIRVLFWGALVTAAQTLCSLAYCKSGRWPTAKVVAGITTRNRDPFPISLFTVMDPL